MIFRALLAHLVSLATFIAVAPISLHATFFTDIEIQGIPDTIVVPVCTENIELTFVVRITDTCFDVDDLSSFSINPDFQDFTIISDPSSGIVLQYDVPVSAANDGETWTVSYEDQLGNVVTDEVTLHVIQSKVDEPPVISPPNFLNYTVSSCEESVFGVLGFVISDDCTPVNPQDVTFDSGGLPLDMGPIIVQNDPYHAYIEFAGDLFPGTFEVQVAYQDVSTAFTVTVTQSENTEPQVIFPGGPGISIPACEVQIQSVFSITILDDCTIPLDPSVYSFFIYRGPDESLEEVFPSLINNYYFEFLKSFSVQDDGFQLWVEYEGAADYFKSDSYLVESCGACPLTIECQGPCEYSTGPESCTAEVTVAAPAILSVADTVSIHVQLVEVESGNVIDSLEIMDVDLNELTNNIGAFSNIPIGNYRLEYLVSNTDNEMVQTECSIQVVDAAGPIAVCNDHFNIVINNEESITFSVEDIDEGSFDHCSAIIAEIRRSFTVHPVTCEPVPTTFGEWSDQITFYQCDLNETVTIELRIWDDGNGDGIPGNIALRENCNGGMEMVSDNFTICSIEEVVQTLFLPTALTGSGHTHDQADPVLYQNTPNPFSKNTLIGFELPEPGNARIIVRDISGKEIWAVERLFEKGYHELMLPQSAAQATGVLFYTLETTNFVETKRMVKGKS